MDNYMVKRKQTDLEKNIKKRIKLNVVLFDKISNFDNYVNNDLGEYIDKLEIDETEKYIKKIEKIENIEHKNIPQEIRILNLNTSEKNKMNMLKMLQICKKEDESDGEKNKYQKAINKLLDVPFGKIVNNPVGSKSTQSDISKYLNNTSKLMDKNIYGHKQTKQQLLEIMAQTISNENSEGSIFCLVGSPGVGKTELMKNIMAPTLNRPFSFIPLGSLSDGRMLNGTNMEWIGSKCGLIIESLISSKCMNPIIFFDELDKVSKTNYGSEIINILIHLTDKTQNNCFMDNYFPNIEFDLSKAILIFSLNDLCGVSRILLDRMKIIYVDGYDINDKLEIISKFTIPKIKNEFNINKINVNITNDIIKYLIENYTNEKGIRKIKEIITDIYSKVNYLRYLKNDKTYNIDLKFLNDEILKDRHKIRATPLDFENSIGKGHGLWASEHVMIGGVLSIFSNFYPTTNYYNVEISGLIGDMMNESIKLAKNMAWNLLDDKTKNKYIEKWKKTPEGINISFTTISEKIDGPSATAMITIIIYSLLSERKIKNIYAVTGEMDMAGNIKEIGGLKEKLYGAKKEGIKHVLCPYENKNDLEQFIDKNKDFFNKDFTIKMVKNIKEIIDEILL
jgi:ATP-dependent Lon protease